MSTQRIRRRPSLAGMQRAAAERRASARVGVFPFDAERVSLLYNGRAAVYQGLHRLGLEPGDPILVPAYSCGSEIDALWKAKLAMRFYRVREDLSPDLDHLEKLCSSPGSGARPRALYVIHYFGCPQPMRVLQDFARAHELFLVEDNALGLYSRTTEGTPLGSFGDVGIFSFTKHLAVPDGGALVLGPGVPGRVETGRAPARLPVLGKTKALVENALDYRLPGLMPLVKRSATGPLVRGLKSVLGIEHARPASGAAGRRASQAAWLGEAQLRLERADWRASGLTQHLLRRIDHQQVCERRVRNLSLLERRLQIGPRLRPLIERIPRSTCAPYYPVLVEDAAALVAHLARHGVESQRFWDAVHPEVPIESFPFEAALKRRVVALPIHQDVTLPQVERLAELLAGWSRS